METCDAAGLRLRVLPGMDDLLNGGHRVHIRDVDINDLLRREPVALDSDAIATLVRGRTVLVTGAGGSIGCEICRQVLRFHPASLVMVERAENNLFMIDRELQAAAAPTRLHPAIGDVLDKGRMNQI